MTRHEKLSELHTVMVEEAQQAHDRFKMYAENINARVGDLCTQLVQAETAYDVLSAEHAQLETTHKQLRAEFGTVKTSYLEAAYKVRDLAEWEENLEQLGLELDTREKRVAAREEDSNIRSARKRLKRKSEEIETLKQEQRELVAYVRELEDRTQTDFLKKLEQENLSLRTALERKLNESTVNTDLMAALAMSLEVISSVEARADLSEEEALKTAMARKGMTSIFADTLKDSVIVTHVEEDETHADQA